MDFSSDKLRLARVLSEDKDFVTVEIAKSLDEPLNVRGGDQFWTLVFVRAIGGGVAMPWLPWEGTEHADQGLHRG